MRELMRRTPRTRMVDGGDDTTTKKSKTRRWVLRSPGRKPTPAKTPKTNARQAKSPIHVPSQPGRHPNDDTRESSEAPRADETCPFLTVGGAASSGAEISPPAGSGSRLRSSLTQLRNMPVPFAGMKKPFRGMDQCVIQPAGGTSTANPGHKQPSSPAEKPGSTTITSALGGESRNARVSALATPELENKKGGATGSLTGSLCRSRAAVSIRDTSQRKSSRQCNNIPHDPGGRVDDKLLLDGGHPSAAAKRGAARDQSNHIPIKAGNQSPRIAFIGVFLNGVGVALASFAPCGANDARLALVKALLLEQGTILRPGSCYTARGSELAVQMVVDQKHRVYACITAEDVPLSLGLSLLEEVQIEYISTASTLAFSTKQHSHNKRCQEQIARSWAKYEAVERRLAHEREMWRLLGEDQPDIESPLPKGNRTRTGTEIIIFQIDAGPQAGLFAAATREILSPEKGGGDGGAIDAGGDCDGAASPMATGFGLLGNVYRKKFRTAALTAVGVVGVCAGWYAARWTNFM